MFPDIDRTLAVINGSGLKLTIGNNAAVTLQRASDPISFAGDVATSARLIAGEIVDLNVMTRRRSFRHRLRRIGEPASCSFDGADIAVVLSFNGSTKLTEGQDVVTLDHGDSAILSEAPDAFRIAPILTNDCYLVLLYKQSIVF